MVFGVAAVLLYLFFIYGKAGDPASLLFVAAGNFVAFYGFSTAVVGLRRAEQQNLLWAAMTTDQRIAWINERQERQRELRAFTDQTEKLSAEIQTSVKQSQDFLKRMKAGERARKRQARLNAMFARPTYGMRKRVGLLTANERLNELSVELGLKELMSELHQEAIRKIRSGQVKSIPVEKPGIRLYPIDGWKIVVADDRLDSDGAQTLLRGLDGMDRDEAGKILGVRAVIGATGEATLEARRILSDAGIEVIDEVPAAAA